MAKILAVFGATGQQGGSVVDFVLSDQELAQEYKIRAVTRNVDSEKAKKLQEKVEVVQGDASDKASLEAALKGVHTVFAMTNPVFDHAHALEAEYSCAKTIADVAVEQGAEYIIFSTLPSVTDISGGKYTKVTSFDAKAKAEQYIRGLKIKSAFFSPGCFMENFHVIPFLMPQKDADGNWYIARHNSPKAELPMINTVEDTGKFIGAILAEPDKYEGKTFCAATAMYSNEDLVSLISKATGQTVIYKQLSLEDYIESLPFGKDIFPEAFGYPEEFGYYGPDTAKLVEWAAKNARGKVTTFEEYLEAHPLQLA